MYKFFFAYITMIFTFFHPALGDENQRFTLNYGENTTIGFFAEKGNSITSLKSHQKTITNKFELDFLDDNLLLSGESERFGISFSNEKFSHSFFHKNTESSAELTIDLIGRSNTRSGGVKVFFKSNKSLTTPPTMYKFALRGFISDSRNFIRDKGTFNDLQIFSNLLIFCQFPF